MRRVVWITAGATAIALAARQISLLLNDWESDGPAGGFGNFLARVQEAAAEREVELRAALGLDGRHDAVDGRTLSDSGDNPSAAASEVGDNE